MKARRVPGLAKQEGGQPGDFEVVVASRENEADRRFFWFVCPGPCRMLSALCIDVGPPKKTWSLSGTAEAPTLYPSINHEGCWHGWLRNGEFSLA